jgi:hypothetical protein
MYVQISLDQDKVTATMLPPTQPKQENEMEEQCEQCDQCGETYPRNKGWTKERTVTNKDGSVEEVVTLCRTNKCEQTYVEDNKLKRTGTVLVNREPGGWADILRDTKLRSDGVDFTRSTDLKY